MNLAGELTQSTLTLSYSICFCFDYHITPCVDLCLLSFADICSLLSFTCVGFDLTKCLRIVSFAMG